jgi:4-amino-4-deoxy-L-arabinose transferase-like glycosyltransferase
MPGRRLLWFALLVAAILPYFMNLGATSIIDANEAFYTETPREMMESGDCLNSTFNYEPRFNKPPLSYWAVLASYQAFGLSLWAARLPIALGAVVMLATAFVLGRVAFSPLAGWLAALTLAASPRFLLFARRIIIDVYSSMFLGLTLLFFVLALSDCARRRRWLMAMYVSIGLGVLTKGPIAIVIPGLVFAAFLILSGRLGAIRHLMIPAGALVVAAIVVPYYAALYAAHGWDYIVTFLVRENLARYAEGVGAPNRGALFYLPVVFTDLYFPWSLLLPVGLAFVPWRRLARIRCWREIWGSGAVSPLTQTDIRFLLGLWIALIVVFYSLSRGQQDLYVLPFVTAGAALVGGVLAGMIEGTLSPRRARWARGLAFVMLAVMLVLGLVTVWLLYDQGGPLYIVGGWPSGIVLAVAAVAALVCLARDRRMAATLVSLGGVLAVLWVVVLVALPGFERYKPVPILAEAISAAPVQAQRVGVYRFAAPSLVFYLRRHVEEMFDADQLHAFLKRGGGGYCLIRGNDYAAIKDTLPVPTRIVATAPRFDIRLDDVLRRAPLPTLVLITTD